MIIDRKDFATECIIAAAAYGVDAHYLVATAQALSGISDDVVDGQFGPYRFTQAKWDHERAQLDDSSQLLAGVEASDISNWRKQCLLAASMTARFERAMRLRLGRRPDPLELATEQWSVAPEPMRIAVNNTAGLVPAPIALDPPISSILEISVKVDSGEATILQKPRRAERARDVLSDVGDMLSDVGSGVLSVVVRGIIRRLGTRARWKNPAEFTPTFSFPNLSGIALPSLSITGGLSRVWRGTRMLASKATPSFRAPAVPEERRVDLALLRMDGSGAVTTQQPLVALSHYRVRVHIGQPLPESLVLEPPPPIMPLLSASEDGHDLEVALFGKDFTVVGASSASLFLPKEGVSNFVFFEVIAPEHVGTAQLRVGVYHQNHLVQSFVLDAFVSAEQGALDRARGFSLEFSRTASFRNLAALAPRPLSIGLNSNGATTHGLFVKSEGAAVEFSLPQKLLDGQTDAFRKLLQQATFLNGKSRFDSYPNEGDPIRPDFHEFAGKFADFGHQLYLALMQRLALQPALRKLARLEGETIQIVRFDPNFVLPWAVIYDFQLPIPIAGAPPPVVCRGVKAGENGTLIPCGHKPEDKVYCINGFWGVRHVIEELIGDGGAGDAVNEITRTRSEGAVRLAVDVPEPHTEEMRKTFETEMGTSFAAITSHDAVLDLLWKDAERPALLIVVGHLETATIAGEPIGPRIVLPNGWLLPGEILQRVSERSWEQQPRTLVLLMGCQTALTDQGTLIAFGAAFESARAAGVVGTEVVAFSRLLTRFAMEVTLALWREQTLGAAVAGFRRRLLVAGNPLAFIFQALGGADIHLSLKGKP